MTLRGCARFLGGTACLAALAGCGGGGGGARPQPAPVPPAAVAPTPTPTPPPPPPPPAPTPTPTPSALDDAEYRRSEASILAHALTAYQAGATGRGVKVAIIDSGIDTSSPEFAGRIDPASRDVIASRNFLTDNVGHGTSVAGVAAAARNGSLIQGVAYDATILAFRTEQAGPCKDDECLHNDQDIAVGVDLARENGARVINISLGGGVPSSPLLNALGRATSAGIVVVISAGNDGRKAEGDNPDPFAVDSARAAGNGLLIIAGSHEGDRATLSDFSNKAGSGAPYYLTALGREVRSFDHSGAQFLYTGTSYSAPVISGAAALLAQAFPTLTGAQIVSLLFSSADDAGAPGVDPVFGNGILNLARAFQPRGATSLAGSSAPVSLTDNGQASPAMGDGSKGPAMAGVVILDGYSRAYAVDLARTLSRAAQERPLAAALQADVSSATALAGSTAVSVTMRRNLRGTPEVGLAQAGLSYQDSRQARAVAGLAISRLTPQTAVALGFSESGKTLQQRLAGAAHSAFLVARDPLSRTGFAPENGSAMGVRHDLGAIALTLTAERGRVTNPGLRRSIGEPGYTMSSISADRRIGPATLTLGATRLSEAGTILGGRFGSAFGGGGAATTFVDAAASFELGGGWGAAASYRRGWTMLPGGAGMVEGGRMQSDAFALDVSKRGAFAAGDRLALRLMQPLRVRSGGFDLSVPTSYDYFTREVGYEARVYSLAPSGRELDIEAAYGIGVLGGDLSANLFLRTDPGHVEAMRSDLGGAIRFTLGF